MSQRDRFEEIWVNLPSGESMCAMVNGDIGWLMYLRENGDAGFSSRNPSYSGPESDRVEFYLENGQRDLYPRSWTIPVAEVRAALEHFRINGRAPTFISWHNDSDDGSTIEDA